MEIYISWYIIWESTFDVFLLSTSPSIDYVLYIAADSFRSHFLPVPYSIFPLRPGLSELLCSEAAALVSTSLIDRSTREKNNKEMAQLFSKAAALQRLINNRSRAGPSYRPA